MSNEKNDEKTFGRKPKGSNMKSNSSWVSAVPNEKLKGEFRWEKRRQRITVDLGGRSFRANSERKWKRLDDGKDQERNRDDNRSRKESFVKRTVLETDTGG